MEIRELHSWDVGIEEAKQIQARLSKKLIVGEGPERIRLVAGADVSYNLRDQKVWGGVVVFDIQRWEVVEEQGDFGEVVFPYVPGYLSFREIPVLLKVFKKIKTIPDVVLSDGQGVAHPRRMGIASHIGLFLEIPTVGCAKSRLVGTFEPVGERKGSCSRLRIEGEDVGWVLRTRGGVKPVFVSPGHRVGPKKALEVVLGCCGRYRVPEPLRRAHILVNQLRQRNFS